MAAWSAATWDMAILLQKLAKSRFEHQGYEPVAQDGLKARSGSYNDIAVSIHWRWIRRWTVKLFSKPDQRLLSSAHQSMCRNSTSPGTPSRWEQPSESFLLDTINHQNPDRSLLVDRLLHVGQEIV